MNLINPLDKALGYCLAALMVAMVASVVWQVLSRYLFVVPAAWTEEVARFLLIWIGMLGAAFAYRHGSHLGISLMSDRLAEPGQRRLAVVVHAICLLFAVCVLVVGGSSLVFMTWELNQVSAAMGLPIAVVYGVIPLAGLLICLFAADGMMHAPTRGGD